jgi:DNA polymerase III delta prime subunit
MSIIDNTIDLDLTVSDNIDTTTDTDNDTDINTTTNSNNTIKTKDDSIYFLERFRPKKLEDFIGQEEQVRQAREWIYQFKKKTLPKNKKGLLLIGPPGVGKTTFAHILLETSGFLCKEFNGSTLRSEKDVRNIIDRIMYSPSILEFMRGNRRNVGIVMDEIDGGIKGDSGGHRVIIDYLKSEHKRKQVLAENKRLRENKKSKNKGVSDKVVHLLYSFKNPIICISNTDDKRIADIKRYSECIYFTSPSETNMKKYIQHICKNIDIVLPDKSFGHIWRHSQGDFRRVLHVLNIISTNFNTNEKITLKMIKTALNLHHMKDTDLTFINAIQEILHLSTSSKRKHPTLDDTRYLRYGNTRSKQLMSNISKYIECEIILIPMLLYENFIPYMYKCLEGDIADKWRSIYKSIEYILIYCNLENVFNIGRKWDMAYYIIPIWCLILYNAYKPFTRNKELEHINFTSILSVNNGKFNDIRTRELLSRGLNMDYSLIPYLSNLCFADVVYQKKQYNKLQKTKNQNELDIAECSSKKKPGKITKSTKNKKPKKPTKKERLQRMKDIYCGTDLFHFIRENNLEKKSIDKLCSLSKCDTLWSDNQIIREFIDSVDSL